MKHISRERNFQCYLAKQHFLKRKSDALRFFNISKTMSIRLFMELYRAPNIVTISNQKQKHSHSSTPSVRRTVKLSILSSGRRIKRHRIGWWSIQSSTALTGNKKEACYHQTDLKRYHGSKATDSFWKIRESGIGGCF